MHSLDLDEYPSPSESERHWLPGSASLPGSFLFL
jgi:hypothetical protein